MWSRRRLLESGTMIAAGAALGRWRSANAEDALRLRRGATGARLAADFIGLGYEMSSVARAGLLSANNEVYVRLVRGLGAGVVRVGGIVADYTSYEAAGEARDGAKDTVITRASLQDFRGFLDAVGWRVIWSVNFGRGTLEEAVVEAKAVAEVLGPRLLAVELGNEVENYGRGRAPLRARGYGYEAYRAEFARWRAALVEAVPGLKFAAPDTAADVDWVERMAADARGDVQLLTTHYYRGDQKLGTEAQLMATDPELTARLERLRRASRESGIPWRMCETNSFYGGGRPGVSDTLAGALWTLDFMLRLAANGCSGVNVETGVNQLGFVSSYSPIQDDGQGANGLALNRAGAPYYGMLAFAVAARGADTVAALEGGGEQLPAYVLEGGGRVQAIVLVNRGPAVKVMLPGLPERGTMMRLDGTSLESGHGIRLGGSAVDERGEWHASRRVKVGRGAIDVGAGSAVVVLRG